MHECPSPFLKDPLAIQGSNDTLDPHYCRFGCCIPCPAQNLVSYFFVMLNQRYSHAKFFFLK